MKRKCLFLLFFCASLHLSAQEMPELKLPNYATKTPEAAAFMANIL